MSSTRTKAYHMSLLQVSSFVREREREIKHSDSGIPSSHVRNARIRYEHPRIYIYIYIVLYVCNRPLSKTHVALSPFRSRGGCCGAMSSTSCSSSSSSEEAGSGSVKGTCLGFGFGMCVVFLSGLGVR